MVLAKIVHCMKDPKVLINIDVDQMYVVIYKEFFKMEHVWFVNLIREDKEMVDPVEPLNVISHKNF